MNTKKFFATMFLSLVLLFSNFSTALAVEYTDIPDDYWAAEEIEDVVTKNIVPIFGDNTYRPKERVTRVEWTGMLLRALGLSQAPITAEPFYSDITKDTFGYENIARAEQFGLIYGYTDGEFKPQRFITKVETASIMSQIQKLMLMQLDNSLTIEKFHNGVYYHSLKLLNMVCMLTIH